MTLGHTDGSWGSKPSFRDSGSMYSILRLVLNSFTPHLTLREDVGKHADPPSWDWKHAEVAVLNC